MSVKKRNAHFWFWFCIGTLIGGLLLVLNVFTEQEITIPFLIVYIGTFRVHHAYVGISCVILGFLISPKKSTLWCPLLFGMGFILLIDDLQDFINILRGSSP